MFSVINVIAASGLAPSEGWQAVLLFVLEFVPTFALTPRFILGIRKLYARDAQRGRGEEIDDGLDLSLPGGNPLGMAMGFLDAEQNVGLEDVESSGRGAAGTASGFVDSQQNEGLDFFRDVWVERGEGIDAGFGLSTFGRDAVGMTMGYAEDNEGLKDIEEISIEVRRLRER